jgi:hypothetical protein
LAEAVGICVYFIRWLKPTAMKSSQSAIANVHSYALND